MTELALPPHHVFVADQGSKVTATGGSYAWLRWACSCGHEWADPFPHSMTPGVPVCPVAFSGAATSVP
jgi:hypothetical protein